MTQHVPRRTFLKSAAIASAGLCIGQRSLSAADGADDPVTPWRSGVTIRPVSPHEQRHSVHTYYLLNPESPDGRRVLFYTSTAANGHVGEVRVLERATGRETVLADEVHTEDAHRVALQQWTLDGKAVAYHEVVNKRWRVVVVDVESGVKTIVAEDRQLAFGRGNGHVLPVYGPHWNPGEHRGLELYDLKAGELRVPCSITAVEQQYGAWLAQEFQGKPTSIAFPTISPDHRRVFFKMSAGNGGDNFLSKAASHRQGILFFDLQTGKLTHMRPKWGHPAWHPDSFHWLEMGNILFDADGGPTGRIANVPVLRGEHLAISPQGKLFVKDGLTESLGGPAGEWALLVADLRGERHHLLHKFIGNRGAKSWRPNHPHPVFSADGRRIYFNINAGDFTQLHVAEITA